MHITIQILLDLYKLKKRGWRLHLHLKCLASTELVETWNHKKTCLFDSCCMTPTPVADLIKVPSELQVKSNTLNISRGRRGPASACCRDVRETPTCLTSWRSQAWISQADGSSVTSWDHAPHICWLECTGFSRKATKWCHMTHSLQASAEVHSVAEVKQLPGSKEDSLTHTEAQHSWF